MGIYLPQDTPNVQRGQKETEFITTRGTSGDNPITQGQLAYIKRTALPSPNLLNFCRDLLSELRLVFYLLSDDPSLNALLKHLLGIKVTNTASLPMPYLCPIPLACGSALCGWSRTNGIKAYFWAFHVRRLNVSAAF